MRYLTVGIGPELKIADVTASPLKLPGADEQFNTVMEPGADEPWQRDSGGGSTLGLGPGVAEDGY